jgi:hypothetical protein
MTYTDFYIACKSLKDFLQEQQELNAVFRVLSVNSTVTSEFGNNFIDQYIAVVELAIEDKFGLFSWFVFENNFGKNELVFTVNNYRFKICNEQQFYDVYIFIKQNKT